LRYSLGMRAHKQDEAILANPNSDDGDRNFKNHSVVTNCFDLLSELDLVWQKDYGARVSAAAWWDPAYNSLDNTSVATANTLSDGVPVAGQLSPFTKRYAKGASAEWLDAFAFVNFDVGGVPVKMKAGQHTVYWGRACFWAASCTASPTRRTPWTCGKASPLPEPRPRKCSARAAASRSRRSPRRTSRSPGSGSTTGRAARIPESG
jgi:hypothetical protein